MKMKLACRNVVKVNNINLCCNNFTIPNNNVSMYYKQFKIR